MNSEEQFLIEEYENTSKQIRHMEVVRRGYIHYFILIIAALFAFIGTIAERIPFSPFTTAVLVIIGIVYGTKMIKVGIKVRIETCSYVRQLNVIRKYFLERYEKLKDCLQFEVSDDKPKFYNPESTALQYLSIISILTSLLYPLFLFNLFFNTAEGSIGYNILNSIWFNKFYIHLTDKFSIIKSESGLYNLLLFVLLIIIFIIAWVIYKCYIIIKLSNKEGKFIEKIDSVKKDYKKIDRYLI